LQNTTQKDKDSSKKKNFQELLHNVDDFMEEAPKIVEKKELLYKIEFNQITELVDNLSNATLPKNYLSYKDVLREKLSQKFSLQEKDMVLFLEDGIYIKFFKQIENKDSSERRACGLAPEFLEEQKVKYFPEESFREKIFELLPYIIEDVLSYKKLDPKSFKKIFVHTFVNLVEIIVIKKIKSEDFAFIRGMSFYLLRSVFDELMLFIADDILYNFANKDKKAEEFLSLFSVHEIIDKKGNRHKPNPILDENNHAWNMTTIRSTMLQHKRAQQAIYEKRENLETIKKKLDTYKMEQVKLSKKIQKHKDEKQDIEKSLKKIQDHLEKIKNATSEKVKFKDAGVEKIFDRKPLLVKVLKKEDDLLTKRHQIDKDIEALEGQINNKQKDIDIWKKKYEEGKKLLKNIQKSGHPTDKLYDNIKKALAKTLARR
jgi:hypothetical protein